jgi:DNA repair protein RecN (Recombination protein N)
MLLELRAENYAVIDHAVAGFGPGLNLMTGETGAGKSILIDALAMLLGDKASVDFIRHGAEKAVVSCVFESTPGAESILEANGIDPAAADSSSGEILLRREIARDAAGGVKGRVFINSQPATVAVLRQLAPELALIHAQSETLGAFDQSQQRGLLDRFANLDDDEANQSVASAFNEWHGFKNRLQELESHEQDRLRMADMWSFQHKEIDDAKLESADEDTRLEAEKRVLANAEKLYTAAMNAHDVLYESNGSAASLLRTGLKHMEELARYEPKFADTVQQLAAAQATVEDASISARDYAESINASPEKLAEIEDRLALLDRLKRKYSNGPGPTALAEVIEHREVVAQKLAEIENHDALLAETRKQLEASAEKYSKCAERLSNLRVAAAKKLEKLAEKHINDLAMKARFAVLVEADKSPDLWSLHGWDRVEYRIATNPGEPLKPLDEIASGGEMSRVLLALKVSVEEGASVKAGKKAQNQLPRTLIFDEIDIGIGGRAAEAVGQKLKALSWAQQVICITHLPQIAAFADQHFLIEKGEKAGRTTTSVRLMESKERAEEIARMLSGATVTEASLKHARQMIEQSQAQ